MPRLQRKKRPGPDPETLKIEGDPEEQFRKLLRPKPKREKPRKNGSDR